MPRMIPEEVKEDIRLRNDIVEVVGSYLQLKRAGSSFKALCPFHKEKTDSFIVNPQRQTYHCFGCGGGGDVFTFIQHYEGVDFMTSMRMLADRAGVQLKFDEEERKRNPLYDCMQEAQDLYFNLLRSDEGREARDYLKQREITIDTADKFGLGFAPNEWDFLLKRLSGGVKTIEEAGLIAKSRGDERGEGRLYDRFRNRLMFPIYNSAGKVIAFSGRTLESENFAKYINSPETSLFKKSRIFYGMRQAQRAIYDTNQAVIVEGNISVLQANQNNLENFIAASGTAFTEDHREILLRRFPNAEFLFMFDGDKAGEDAAARTSIMMLGRGNARVVSLPEGEDPDDVLRDRGKEFLQKKMKQARPALDFYVDLVCEKGNYDLSSVEGAVGLLGHLRKPIEDAPEYSHNLILDNLSERTGLRQESLKDWLFQKRVVRGEMPVDVGRRRLETIFMKQLIRDGRPDTIRYFSEKQDIGDMLQEQETRYMMSYLRQEAVNNPLFHNKDPLFVRDARKKIVEEVMKNAKKEGVILNERYLRYLFSPLREEEQLEMGRVVSEEQRKEILKRCNNPSMAQLELPLSLMIWYDLAEKTKKAIWQRKFSLSEVKSLTQPIKKRVEDKTG